MSSEPKNAVILYVVPGCPLCADVREWLETKGVPFEERDVANDFGARKRFYKNTRQSLVPVLEHQGKFFVRPTDTELRTLFEY